MSSVRDRENITEYIFTFPFEEFFTSHKGLKGIIKYSVGTSGESHLIGKGLRSPIDFTVYQAPNRSSSIILIFLSDSFLYFLLSLSSLSATQ